MALWFFSLLQRLFSVIVETLKHGKEFSAEGNMHHIHALSMDH